MRRRLRRAGFRHSSDARKLRQDAVVFQRGGLLGAFFAGGGCRGGTDHGGFGDQRHFWRTAPQSLLAAEPVATLPEQPLTSESGLTGPGRTRPFSGGRQGVLPKSECSRFDAKHHRETGCAKSCQSCQRCQSCHWQDFHGQSGCVKFLAGLDATPGEAGWQPAATTPPTPATSPGRCSLPASTCPAPVPSPRRCPAATSA